MPTDAAIEDALSSASEKSIALIQFQAEALLGQMGQMAVASDARAMNMAALCVTVSLAVTGSTALWSSGTQMCAASLMLALLLFVAAVLFAWSGRPVDFNVAGHEPRKLVPSSASDLWMAIYVIHELQGRVDANRGIMERSSRLFNIAGVLALGALPVGVLTYCAVGWFTHPS